MAIGFYNQDSSFFEVLTGNDNTVGDASSINKEIISLSVVEEFSKIITGTIQMYDPFNVALDRILHVGQKLKISWGYKRPDSSLLAAFSMRENPDEVQGLFKRTGVEVFVMNVSGEGTDDGQIIYNCNFMGSAFASGMKQKIYTGMKRGDVIREVLTRMKIPTSNQLVNFRRQNEMLTQDTALLQYESNFQFINRMSFEMGAVFSIGQGSKGSVALFADYNTKEMERFSNMVSDSSGNSFILNYKQGTANVQSYSFQQLAGDAAGDNVQIIWIGNQPTFQRFRAEEQRIVDYKIDTEKIKKYIQSYPGLRDKSSAIKELLQIDNFKTLVDRQFFVETVSMTAPQGYGWKFNILMLGNPLFTSPMRANFGKGFPSICTSKKTSFWTERVNHIVDRSGYHMNLDVADALTLTGGSYVS